MYKCASENLSRWYSMNCAQKVKKSGVTTFISRSVFKYTYTYTCMVYTQRDRYEERQRKLLIHQGELKNREEANRTWRGYSSSWLKPSCEFLCMWIYWPSSIYIATAEKLHRARVKEIISNCYHGRTNQITRAYLIWEVLSLHQGNPRRIWHCMTWIMSSMINIKSFRVKLFQGVTKLYFQFLSSCHINSEDIGVILTHFCLLDMCVF